MSDDKPVEAKQVEAKPVDKGTDDGLTDRDDSEEESEFERIQREKMAMGVIYPENDPTYVNTREVADADRGDTEEDEPVSRREQIRRQGVQ